MGDGRIGGRKDSEGRSKRPGKRAPRRIEKHCYIIMTVLVDHVKHLLQRNLISLRSDKEQVISNCTNKKHNTRIQCNPNIDISEMLVRLDQMQEK